MIILLTLFTQNDNFGFNVPADIETFFHNLNWYHWVCDDDDDEEEEAAVYAIRCWDYECYKLYNSYYTA
jgi:hypothetical protein